MAETLGCVVEINGDVWALTYDGGYGQVTALATVGSDVVIVNGAEVEERHTHPVEVREDMVYVPLNFWSMAVSSVGKKTELHGFHWFISLRTKNAYMIPVEGADYAFAAGELRYNKDGGGGTLRCATGLPR